MTPLRISKLALSSFKGFRSPIELDFQADLILLIGPNGHGKTSIIEAIELIATGGIQQRIGDKKEFSTRDFIHRRAEEQAKVRLTWEGTPNFEQAHLLNEDGDVSVEGPWSKMREAGWSRQGRKNLLRTTSFLYSDALGAMLGLDLDARKEILDSYIPEGDRLSELGANLESLRVALNDARLKVTASLPNRDALSEADARAARAVEHSWVGLSAKEIRFTRRGEKGGLLKAPEASLLSMADELRVLIPRDIGLSGMLGVMADEVTNLAKQEQLDIEEEALAEGTEDADVVIVEERMREIQALWGTAAIPSPSKIEHDSDYFGTESDISSELNSVNDNIQTLNSDLDKLWHEEHLVASLPNGATKLPVGIIPLLLNLSRATLPDAWPHKNIFRASIEAATGILEDELCRWSTICHKIDALRVEAQVVEERLKYRRRVSLLQPIVQSLAETWKRRFGGNAIPTTSVGDALDLAAMQQAIRDIRAKVPMVVPAAERKPARLRALGEALRTWASKRRDLEQAEKILTSNPKRTGVAKELDHLGRFIDRLGKRGQNDLSTRLRAEAVTRRYSEPIDTAMRRVLAGYAHREDFSHGAHARFDKQGYFRVSVGDEKGSTGISSLSRSQLTSIAFSLAVAANLGQPDPPLGFLCLDDVSDAFDLNNLAADACMLRMLAYGTGRTRRQLVLTNHSDELTDRLVPLLLPPNGRSMRIVQLVGQPAGDIKIKQWKVQEELKGHHVDSKSPLRSLYRPTTP